MIFCITSFTLPRYSHSLSPCSHGTLQIMYLYHTIQSTAHSWTTWVWTMLVYLHTIFLQYCTINECSIPNGFNIFSLAHFIIRNTVYKTYIYKICVSWLFILFILSVRLAVNSRVSLIKCLGNQKLYVNFWQHKGGHS